MVYSRYEEALNQIKAEAEKLLGMIKKGYPTEDIIKGLEHIREMTYVK
ncbi:MAG: hypothetical protein U5R49_21995 [Deltaproteobacteria bacterium]|nr:hypothetical protein [Deltaproteobacteria bacterium]